METQRFNTKGFITGRNGTFELKAVDILTMNDTVRIGGISKKQGILINGGLSIEKDTFLKICRTFSQPQSLSERLSGIREDLREELEEMKGKAVKFYEENISFDEFEQQAKQDDECTFMTQDSYSLWNRHLGHTQHIWVIGIDETGYIVYLDEDGDMDTCNLEDLASIDDMVYLIEEAQQWLKKSNK